MKQKISLLLLALFVFSTVAPQALALNLNVERDGTVRFYDNSVLGVSDQAGQASQDRPTSDRGENSDRATLRQMNAQENKNLRISATSENNLKLMEKSRETSGTGEDMPTTLPSTESIDAERLSVEFSVAPTARVGEDMLSDSDENSDATAQAELFRGRNEYSQEVLRERAERARNDEKAKIVLVGREDRPQLFLISMEVRALLKDGAEFEVDPETNTLYVVAPSGSVIEVNNLPDQAIDRLMRMAQLKESDLNPVDRPLEMVVSSDGDLRYQLTVTRQKRLFGIFKRDVDYRVSLNDATGEIASRRVPKANSIQNFFDLVSF